jgi:hypothetical protein
MTGFMKMLDMSCEELPQEEIAGRMVSAWVFTCKYTDRKIRLMRAQEKESGAQYWDIHEYHPEDDDWDSLAVANTARKAFAKLLKYL